MVQGFKEIQQSEQSIVCLNKKNFRHKKKNISNRSPNQRKYIVKLLAMCVITKFVLKINKIKNYNQVLLF